MLELKNAAFQAGIVGKQRVGKSHMLGGDAPERERDRDICNKAPERIVSLRQGLMQEAVY